MSVFRASHPSDYLRLRLHRFEMSLGSEADFFVPGFKNTCLSVRERAVLFVKNESRWTNRRFRPFVVGAAAALSEHELPVSSRTDSFKGLTAAFKTLSKRKSAAHNAKALCKPAVFDSK